MVVDDSAVVRGLISREIEGASGMTVVASASNGEMALMELKRRSVDVVVLDIEMPVMDGMTALPLILADRPGIKVLITSTLTRRNGEITLRALQFGASDYLAKPDAGTTLVTAEDFKRDLIAKIRALGPQAKDAFHVVLESCAFQDLTGQRLLRVENLLTGAANAQLDPLLNGPALTGRGLDQAAADALFADFDAPNGTSPWPLSRI